MNAELTYLFAGFAVFWAGLLAYLAWLQARLRSLQREVERLEERLAEQSPALDTADVARTSTTVRVAPDGGA